MLKLLTAEGVALREFKLADATELYEFVSANRAYLSEWLEWANGVHSVADAERFLRDRMDDMAREGLPSMGIWQAGQMAGGVVCFALAEPHGAELAYWLGAAFAGHGLMTDVLTTVLDYLFDMFALERVQIRAETSNLRSRAVAERLGFTFESVELGGWTHGDTLTDLAVYGMTAESWKARPTL